MLTGRMNHLHRHSSFYCDLFSLYSRLLAGDLWHLRNSYYLLYRDISSYYHLPGSHNDPQSKCLHYYNNHGRNTSKPRHLYYNLFPRKTCEFSKKRLNLYSAHNKHTLFAGLNLTFLGNFWLKQKASNKKLGLVHLAKRGGWQIFLFSLLRHYVASLIIKLSMGL